MKEIDKLKAILIIETGFVVLYFLSRQKHPWMLVTAAAIGAISLMIPVAGDWIVKLWFKIAEVLGWINSRILLSIIFYVFLFPISLLARLANKNPLNIKKQPGSTFYEIRDHKYVKDDLENIW